MTTRHRVACALVAFPVAWAVRQAASPAAGGALVLALIGLSAVGLPRRAGLLTVAAGIACFVAVHLIAAVTAVGVGLAVGSLLFAAVGWRIWRGASSPGAATAA